MKKKNKQLIIPFVGLKEGIHHYEFELNSSFFEQFDYSIIKKADFLVNVAFDKRKNLFNLKFDLKGVMYVNCDRCLEELKINRKGSEELIVKFGDENYNETDEIRVIPNSEYQLNITNEVYQYIHLLLPNRVVHKNDEDCNKDIIEKLKELSNKPKNTEIDPRWSALSKLKDKRD